MARSQHLCETPEQSEHVNRIGVTAPNLSGAFGGPGIFADWVPSDAALWTERPHPARIADLLLGGKDHFRADRAAVERLTTVEPALPLAARARRQFVERAMRYVAGKVQGLLVVGAGLPTAPPIHELVQLKEPQGRVVYVDDDPIVLAHLRARTACPVAPGHLRKPEALLAAPEVRRMLAPGRPVAVLLEVELELIEDAADPQGLVTKLVEALPSGSFLLLSHATADFAPQVWDQLIDVYDSFRIRVHPRSWVEVAGFLDGLELEPPGLELVSRWRPAPGASYELSEAAISRYGVIGRKA
ncbi:SAM-dependent methyltransferase [Kitasatospora sp. NPDC052896]|uniref:SAM-dependent methyltransferase n=1 Tax=Kitasatospora sp. NPDC052896 TaxID=3364061 RepID=UPI0037C6E1CC